MKISIEHCLGASALSTEQYVAALEKAVAGVAQVRAWYDQGSLPLLRLPERRDDLEELKDLADTWRRQKSNIVILGTGGSNLGAKTLYALADKGFGRMDGGPAMHFMDNVDPTTFDALMSALRPATTAVLAVSKSGTTAETLSQTLVLRDWLVDAVGEGALKHHMAVLTEPKPSPLRDFADQYELPTFDHDPLVGGRFSVLEQCRPAACHDGGAGCRGYPSGRLGPIGVITIWTSVGSASCGDRRCCGGGYGRGTG